MAVDVRDATYHDAGGIRLVYTSAFSSEESQVIAKLATDLLRGTTPGPSLSLVAVSDCEAVGHVAFTPVEFAPAATLTGHILAPLAVRPDSQRGGVGTRLVAEGLARLRARRADVVFVYGDPRYYGRFGFTAASATPFTPPHELSQPEGWLGMWLAAERRLAGPLGVRVPPLLDDPDLW